MFKNVNPTDNHSLLLKKLKNVVIKWDHTFDLKYFRDKEFWLIIVKAFCGQLNKIRAFLLKQL